MVLQKKSDKHTYDDVEHGDVPQNRDDDHEGKGDVPETLDILAHVIISVWRTPNEVIVTWNWGVRCLFIGHEVQSHSPRALDDGEKFALL